VRDKVRRVWERGRGWVGG